MSHFTVMVFGEDPKGQLAPYQENNMGDCPKKYLKFESIEEEAKEKYSESVYMYRKGLDLRHIYDHQFRDEINKDESWKNPSEEQIIEAGWDKVLVPWSTIHKTFDDFVYNYHGLKARDPEHNEYGYWHNPNSKWDWYQLGGRWTGFFRVKQNAVGVAGEKSLISERECPPEHADQLKKGDIDLDYMMDKAGDAAAERYDTAMTIIGKFPDDFKRWDKMIEPLIGKDNSNLTAEQYRAEKERLKDQYNSQPLVKKWKEAKEFPGFFGPQLEDFMVSRNEYIENARRGSFSPYAVILNGEWYAQGDMLMFGMSDDYEGNWLDKFYELFVEMDDDTLVSLYDCHV